MMMPDQIDASYAPSGVGDRLRAAREARGLSIADIAQTLKFSPRQVELVEGNAWSELPGQTFIRGCVRNYSRMLQLDPEPLLRELESANLPKAAVLAVPGTTNAKLPAPGAARRRDLAAVLAGLLLVVLAVAAYFLVPADFWPARTQAMQAVRASPAPTGGMAPSVAAPMPATALPPVTESGPPPAPASAAAAAAAAVLPPASAAADAATPGANALLRFEFDQASWVEVRDSNGALVHSQNNAAGTVQEVNGTIPLSVVIGDARRVRMVFKDKVVDLAPYTNASSNVARLNIE